MYMSRTRTEERRVGTARSSAALQVGSTRQAINLPQGKPVSHRAVDREHLQKESEKNTIWGPGARIWAVGRGAGPEVAHRLDLRREPWRAARRPSHSPQAGHATLLSISVMIGD